VKGKFCLDGFPRRASQAEALDTILRKNELDLEAVILLYLPEEILLERITGKYHFTILSVHGLTV